MAPRDFLSAKFELIVSLEGVVEPTGNSVQARSSYLPNEILWGYRFKNLMKYNKTRGIYSVDCSNLNAVVQDDTPQVSAKVLDEKRRLDAKRFATVRKKISAISRAASVRQPHPPGSKKNYVVNPANNKNDSDSEDSDGSNGMSIPNPPYLIFSIVLYTLHIYYTLKTHFYINTSYKPFYDVLPIAVIVANAPKVTITPGSDDDSRKSGSRRGSIAMTRQLARDIEDTDEQQRHDQLLKSNNTNATIIE